MTDEQLNEQQSVQLIRTMLERTQHQVSDNGFYFLLWGWLVFICAAFNYIGWMIFGPKEFIFLPWAVLMPLGGIVSAVYGSRQKKKENVVTYTQELLNKVLIAYLVSLLIILLIGMYAYGWEKCYPFLMIIYGVWLFVSGSAIRFRGLVAGGIFTWCCAAATFFVPTPHQLLMLAVAVLGGFIIPGHLLRNRFRKNVHEAV